MASNRQASSAQWAALLFFLFVILGCAYIAAAKMMAFNPFAVTFVPVGIMVAYAAIQGILRAVRLRDDQAGDNLYYMGFLFTLTSLGVSLYQFSQEGAAEEIVRNFGIAIGSTIAGIALRVLFNQMRQDPLDVEQVSRLELAEAARRVRRELDGTAVEMAHFRRSMQQSLRDTFQELQKEVTDIAGALSAEMTSFPSAVSGPLEAASANSTATLDALARSLLEKIEHAGARLAEESGRLAASTAEITRGLNETAQRLGGLQTPDQILKIQVEPVAAALASAIEGFTEQVGTHLAETNRVLSALEAAGQDEARRAIQMDATVYALQESAAALQRAAERLSGVEAPRAASTFGFFR